MKTSDERALQQIVDAISEQGAKQNEALGKVLELRAYLKEVCDHPRRITKDHYSEGSYFDREEWTTNEYCAYCGHDFGEIRRTVGSYG